MNRWVIAVIFVVAAPLEAQRTDSAAAARPRPARLVGTVYDSVTGRHLAAAWVTVGSSITTQTDSTGRFRIDSVPVGRVRIAVQHGAIDSLGLNSLVTEVPTRAGAEVAVSLSTPSRETLWRAACPGLPSPTSPDTGFIHGTIRDAMRYQPVRGAKLTAVWYDLRWKPGTAVQPSGWQAEGTSDATGTYTLCGIPGDAVIRLQAIGGRDSTGTLDLALDGRFVVRRDLLLAGSTARAGLVAGTVVDATGAPREGARVMLEDVPEARTDARGRFLLRAVPLGSRELHVLALGYAPIVVPVDVVDGDTTFARAVVERIALLSPVRIEQSHIGARLQQEFEARKKSGMGYVVDSAQIARSTSMMGLFSEVPGVYVSGGRDAEATLFFKNPSGLGGGGQCLANIFIDGIKSDTAMLHLVRKDDLAAVEVYQRAAFVPARYLPSLTTCGSLLVWTKRAFR